MEAFEIYIAFIAWGNDGKRRPVLILETDNDHARVFRITSQYAGKSDAIKAQYLEIKDWKRAGLAKVSYIDTGERVRVPLKLITPPTPIGKLSENDKRRLSEFLNT